MAKDEIQDFIMLCKGFIITYDHDTYINPYYIACFDVEDDGDCFLVWGNTPLERYLLLKCDTSEKAHRAVKQLLSQICQ